MLKARIIPTLLWKEHGLVKGVGFDSWRRVGTVLPAIKVYNLREVDELILLDITATNEDRGPDVESIAEFSQESFVPLTVGGGVSNLDDIRNLLRSGADKVAINTAAYAQPDLITKAAVHFGTQCVVASIDARRENGNYYCYASCGQKPTRRKAHDWAKEVADRGAGEIIITSIEKDGTMGGYDLELIRQVSEAVRIPVIASGGAGSYEHFQQALSQANASAVAAASIFHFTEQTPLAAKRYLRSKGIMVRDANAEEGSAYG